MGSRSTDPNRRLLGLKPPGRHGGLPGRSLRGQKQDERRRKKRRKERRRGGAVPGGGRRQRRWSSGDEAGQVRRGGRGQGERGAPLLCELSAWWIKEEGSSMSRGSSHQGEALLQAGWMDLIGGFQGGWRLLVGLDQARSRWGFGVVAAAAMGQEA